MPKQRVPETNAGIQGELAVGIFNGFAKGMRDKGMLHVDSYTRAGISEGRVLEIGPGPGYVGLEWLKLAPNARLTGLEISSNMIQLANKNALAYGFQERANYVQGNSMEMPFPDQTFDGVFSNGSMHEWEFPEKVFLEIYRVLKIGGKFCITDLRRDINPLVKMLVSLTVRPKEIRPGFITSVNAAYTVPEIRELFRKSKFIKIEVTQDFMGLTITGEK